jgi:hypothetical protein
MMIMSESEIYALRVFKEAADAAADSPIVKEAERILREHTPEMEKESYLLFFQNKLGAITTDLHLEWAELLENPRLCILAPRDSGKTHFFVVGYVLWNVYYKRHKLIYIISDSIDQAKDILSKIKDELTDNPAFQHLVDESIDTWTKQEIKTANGVRIKVKGFGSKIRGPHPGLIILDDVLDDISPMTQIGRAKADRYFRSAVSNMLRKSPKSQIIIVGTAQHYKDLLHTLKENTAYVWRKYKAILNDKLKKVLIKERYSYADLLRKKEEIGSLAFAKEFQNEPIDEESTIFPWEEMKLSWDQNFIAPMTYDGHGEFQTFLGADFSTPGNDTGDWTVVATIGITPTGNVFLFDIWRGRGYSFTEQLDVVIERMHRFSVTRGFLESNVFQQIYSQTVQNVTSLPVYGHNVHSGNKNSLLTGVPSMKVLFENMKMVLPYHKDDLRGRTMTDKLCDELHSFRMVDGKLGSVNDHDDIVMALWHALSAYRNKEKGQSASRGHVPILKKGNPTRRRQELSDLAKRGYKP